MYVLKAEQPSSFRNVLSKRNTNGSLVGPGRWGQVTEAPFTLAQVLERGREFTAQKRESLQADNQAWSLDMNQKDKKLLAHYFCSTSTAVELDRQVQISVLSNVVRPLAKTLSFLGLSFTIYLNGTIKASTMGLWRVLMATE